jgi:hypothetical protein
MEPEGLLPHSHELTACPYPEQNIPVHVSPPHFSKMHFNIIIPSAPGFTTWSRFLGVL